jgi:hypothetical protein
MVYPLKARSLRRGTNVANSPLDKISLDNGQKTDYSNV